MGLDIAREGAHSVTMPSFNRDIDDYTPLAEPHSPGHPYAHSVALVLLLVIAKLTLMLVVLRFP